MKAVEKEHAVVSQCQLKALIGALANNIGRACLWETLH